MTTKCSNVVATTITAILPELIKFRILIIMYGLQYALNLCRYVVMIQNIATLFARFVLLLLPYCTINEYVQCEHSD